MQLRDYTPGLNVEVLKGGDWKAGTVVGYDALLNVVNVDIGGPADWPVSSPGEIRLA